ncbi:MAG: ATP-binding protein [Halieaceae bacterium]|jgi:hypothetical protein|nr:ATP-binding protein [Halieaceae bacterium]
MKDPVFIAPDRFATLRSAAAAARRRLLGETLEIPEHPRLTTLVARLGLSAFERDLLLLAAGIEVDEVLVPTLREADPEGPAELSFALPLARLPEAHWSALSPDRPLRYWGLIELAATRPLARAAITIDERILHHLVGLDPLDARLRPFLEPLPAPAWVPDSVQRLAEIAAAAMSATPPRIVAVEADDPRDIRRLAAYAARLAETAPWRLRCGELPAAPEERINLARLWQRETLLTGRALLIEEATAACATIAEAAAQLVVGGNHPDLGGARAREKLRLPHLERNEQDAVWRARLGAEGARLNGALDRVTAHFTLGLADTEEAADTARRGAGGEGLSEGALWDAARSVSRPRLGDLATPMTAPARWSDLVLPEREMATLRAIAAQVRQRRRVYDDWGFAREGARGRGVSVLFSGPSGTGKTLAAEVLAEELRLDLYRIDLSQVVNKYIGETEKNLAAVFDAAEDGGAILLFDEADALFGKRSEVRDSHDRYANVEVAYLLQRMEDYRGLAILTTNFRSALDKAFTRRLRFIVDFPFPTYEERLAIWRGVFPADADTEGIEPERLAQLGVTGGAIRNIALNAAFLAAEEGRPIGMAHLGRAAESECAKLEKKIASGETRGWV